MSSFKRFMCGALAALTLFNAAPPAFASETDLTPKIFSVTVPTEVPIRMDKAGRVSIPQNLKIQNDSNGAIAVTDISVEGKNGWTVVDWTQPTEGKQFAMRFRGDSTKSDGSVALKAGWTVAKKNSLSINAEAKMAKQEKSTKTDIAVINWAFDWAGAGGQETKPEPPKNPDYNIDDDVTKPDDGYNIGDDVTKPEHPINPPVDDRTYTITILPGDHGYAEADSPLKTDKDGIVPVLPVVIPDEGYVFDRWIDENGDEIMAGDTLDNDIAIKPIFTPEEYDNTRTLTPIDGEHGKVNDKTPIETDKNGVVQDNLPNVTPEDGFAFEKWVDGDGNEVRPGDVLDRDVTIKPVFTEIDDTHTLTPVDGEHGTVDDKTPVQTDKHGVVLNNLPSVTPEDGYEFEKWVYADNGEDARPGDILDRDVTIKPIFQEKQLLFSVDYKNGLMLPESSNTATFAWDNAPDDFELAGITSSDPSIAKVSKVFDSANESQKVEVKALKRGIAKFTGVSTTGETADFDVLVSELGDSRPTANIDKAEEIKPGDTIEPDDITVEIPTVTPDGGSDTVTVTPNDVSGGEIEEGKNVVSATVDANGVDITINIIINITINQGTPVAPTDYTHTITINPDGGNGHADSSDPLKTDRDGKVPELPTVTPDEGYVFEKWVNEAGDEVKTGDTIDDNVTITPTFKPDENYKVYTITIESGEHGRADDDSPLKTDANGTVPALPSVTTDEGYVFDKWVDEGVSEVKQGDTLSRDTAITPVFKPEWDKTHILTPIDAEHGTVIDKTPMKTDKSGIVQDNFPKVIPDAGYLFEKWIDEDGKIIKIGSAVNKDITIKPVFRLAKNDNTHTLTPVDGEGGIIPDKTPIKTDENGVVQDNLPNTSPNSGYEFVKWVYVESNKKVKIGDVLTKDVDITPVFENERQKFNVTFDVECYFSSGNCLTEAPVSYIIEDGPTLVIPSGHSYNKDKPRPDMVFSTSQDLVFMFETKPYTNSYDGLNYYYCIREVVLYRENGSTVNIYKDYPNRDTYTRFGYTIKAADVNPGENLKIVVSISPRKISGDQIFLLTPESCGHCIIRDATPILTDTYGIVQNFPDVLCDEGFEFDRWIDKKNGRTIKKGSLIIENITIVPICNPKMLDNPYTLTPLDGSAGTVPDKTPIKTDIYGVVPDHLPDVIPEDGYEFENWIDENGTQVAPGNLLTKDITITPIFKPEKPEEQNYRYHVSFDVKEYYDIVYNRKTKLQHPVEFLIDGGETLTLEKGYLSSGTARDDMVVSTNRNLTFTVKCPDYTEDKIFTYTIEDVTLIRENGTEIDLMRVNMPERSSIRPLYTQYTYTIDVDAVSPEENLSILVLVKEKTRERKNFVLTPVDGMHGIILDKTPVKTDDRGKILDNLPDVKPDYGYKFEKWVDENGNEIKPGIHIVWNTKITPIFQSIWREDEDTYTLTPIDGDHGTVPDKTPIKTDRFGVVRNNLPRVTPEDGYKLDKWVDENGNEIKPGILLNKDITIIPIFIDKTCVLTPIGSAHGTVTDKTPVKTDTYGIVQDNLPDVTPEDNYIFERWINADSGKEVQPGDELTEDITIKPVFIWDPSKPFIISFQTANYYSISDTTPLTATADNKVPMEQMPEVAPIVASHFFDGVWVNVDTDEVVDANTVLTSCITVKPQINCLFTERNGAITGFSEYAQDKNVESITIPNNIMGKTVTRIGTTAFSAHINHRTDSDGRTFSDPNPKAFEVKHVTIQKGITELEKQCFGSYNIFETMNLESISLPNGLKVIGEGAFYECGKLTSITIPDTVTMIGDAAFWDCGLESIHLGKSVRSLGFRAFMWCDSLMHINLPYSLQSIGERCFESAGLESVTVPDGCTVGEQAFIFCENLRTATLGEGTTSLYCTFQRCTNLKTVRLPRSITSINPNAFYYCPNLAYIYIKGSKNSVSGAPWSSSQTHPSVIWTS